MLRPGIAFCGARAHTDSLWRFTKSAVINATVPVEERPSVIERAFQIAKSATVSDVAELTGQLAAEGYGNAEQVLAGRSLALQLTRMIAEAGPPTVL